MPIIIEVDEAEHATILAALRFYQKNGQGDPFNRTDDIHDIATNGDKVMSSLDEQGIDELCERLNFTSKSARPEAETPEGRA